MIAKCLIATLAVCLVATAALADLPLDVMSFNIRYGTANDGENAWRHRRDTVIRTIRKYDPDVFGTQECLEFQAQYMAQNLPRYRWIGVGRDADGHGETTAVFYKAKDLIPIESGHFWLSETPGVPGSVSWDSSLTRMVTWVRFHHPKTGTFFHFFNTHFDHVGAEARANSATLVAERIGALGPDAAVILTGDFNARGEASAPWGNLVKGGLRDAWISAEKRVGPVGTFGGWKNPDPANDSRIDWILFRGPVTAQYCETVTYNEKGRYPSDHYPVFARLAIRN
ncbi:MAG: endonuclease [Nitrospiraceae bacterium]|nr:endonuclease [Nitrospiraceae bacterium]